jgi:hypothetical protein
VAAGADWAKADEMNTVILQIQATGDCMRLGFLNTQAWSLQELVIASQVLAIARQELVIARSVATKQSSHHVLPTELLFFGMKFLNTYKTY